MQSDGDAERACRSLSSEQPPNIAPPSITSQGLVLAGVVGVAHSPQTRHVRILGPLSRRIRCLASVLCQPGVLIVSVLCHQVAVLGRAGVGKTCLIADLCGRGAPANIAPANIFSLNRIRTYASLLHSAARGRLGDAWRRVACDAMGSPTISISRLFCYALAPLGRCMCRAPHL